MANLNEILENANGGEAIPILGQELGLTPEQTQSAITALLPAISSGLKQSTSSVDGLGNLFALMGQQKDLPGLFEDAKTALSPDGLAAGNQALSLIFGSQEASQAIVDQAQKFSGVSSSVLDKMLPALTGIAVSGLMRSGSSRNCPSRRRARRPEPVRSRRRTWRHPWPGFWTCADGRGGACSCSRALLWRRWPARRYPWTDIWTRGGIGARDGSSSAEFAVSKSRRHRRRPGGAGRRSSQHDFPRGSERNSEREHQARHYWRRRPDPDPHGRTGWTRRLRRAGSGRRHLRQDFARCAWRSPWGRRRWRRLCTGAADASGRRRSDATDATNNNASADASAKGPHGRSVGFDEAARRDGRRGRCGLRRSPRSRPECRPEPSRQHSGHPRSLFRRLRRVAFRRPHPSSSSPKRRKALSGIVSGAGAC